MQVMQFFIITQATGAIGATLRAMRLSLLALRDDKTYSNERKIRATKL
jgi:hypothetical protein